MAGVAVVIGGATASAEVVHVPAILERPEGCALALTIQKRGCQVEQVFDCQGPDGPFWRSEEYEEPGLDFVTHFTRSYDLTEASSGDGEFHVLRRTEPAPFPDLAALSPGQSAPHSADLTLVIWGITRDAELREVIRRDDAAVTVPGATLSRFPADAVLTLPEPMPSARGTVAYYLDPQTGVVFEGETTLTFLAPKTEYPNRPAEVLRPGMAGATSTSPRHDCGSISMTRPVRKVQLS